MRRQQQSGTGFYQIRPTVNAPFELVASLLAHSHLQSSGGAAPCTRVSALDNTVLETLLPHPPHLMAASSNTLPLRRAKPDGFSDERRELYLKERTAQGAKRRCALRRRAKRDKLRILHAGFWWGRAQGANSARSEARQAPNTACRVLAGFRRGLGGVSAIAV